MYIFPNKTRLHNWFLREAHHDGNVCQSSHEMGRLTLADWEMTKHTSSKLSERES